MDALDKRKDQVSPSFENSSQSQLKMVRRRRSFNQRDRFPMNIVNGFRRFLGMIQHWLTTPLRWMMQERSTRMVERRPSVFRMLFMPFVWIFAYSLYAIGNAGDLIVGWSRSRPIRALLFGAPAILTALTFGIVLLVNSSAQQTSMRDSYELKATKAESEGRFDTARMYYQRLMQLPPKDKKYDLAIALTYEAEDNTLEAQKRMAKLLTYPQIAAQVNQWMAERTLERDDVDDQTKWIVARGHIRNVLRLAPQDFQASRLGQKINTDLADSYIAKKEYEDAISSLKEAESNLKVVASFNRSKILELAKLQARIAAIYNEMGADGPARDYGDLSKSTAARSIDHYEKIIEVRFDSIPDLIGLSNSYLFVNEFAEAIRPLNVAMKNDRSKKLAPLLIPHKSKVLAAWAENELKKKPPQLSRSLELLDEAIQYNPNNEGALAVLAQIVVLSNGQVSEKAKQMLNSAIAETEAPFVVHVIFGSDAAAKGNYEVANRHFQQAALQRKNTLVVLNNLAYVMARLKTPDYEQAMTLINTAISIQPNNANLLDTRGGIYLLTKQYENAYRDFEQAEMSIKNSERLYKDLIFLSNKLGFEQHERKYSTRLEKLLAKKKLTTVSNEE